MLQERVTFWSMRMRHFVYSGSCTVCPFHGNFNFKNWGVKKNMQPLFCCCSCNTLMPLAKNLRKYWNYSQSPTLSLKTMKWVFTKSLVDALLISLFSFLFLFFFCMLASHNSIVTRDKVALYCIFNLHNSSCKEKRACQYRGLAYALTFGSHKTYRFFRLRIA